MKLNPINIKRLAILRNKPIKNRTDITGFLFIIVKIPNNIDRR